MGTPAPLPKQQWVLVARGDTGPETPLGPLVLVVLTLPGLQSEAHQDGRKG